MPSRNPGILPSLDGPPVRHAFLADAPTAVSRCSGSICSGCGGIRGSMRSFCRRSAWSRRCLPVLCRRPLVGYTAVALATVLTMVLGFGVWLHHMFATGLSNMALAFFSAVSHLDRHPERGFFLRLDCDDLDRPSGLQHRLSFCRRVHHRVRHRRRIRLHDRLGPGRLAADRHLFRGRAYPLRADRLESVRGHGARSITGFRR